MVDIHNSYIILALNLIAWISVFKVTVTLIFATIGDIYEVHRILYVFLLKLGEIKNAK